MTMKHKYGKTLLALQYYNSVHIIIIKIYNLIDTNNTTRRTAWKMWM